MFQSAQCCGGRLQPVVLCVWIRTKADDLALCLCPSCSPPRSGLLNNGRHTRTQLCLIEPCVFTVTEASDLCLPPSWLHVVGGVDGEMGVLASASGVVWEDAFSGVDSRSKQLHIFHNVHRHTVD